MISENTAGRLETKFQQFDGETGLKRGSVISGYASVFGATDQGGDIVQPGAYANCLKALAESGRSVKMLWQHDPTQPIGVWDEVREDATNLFFYHAIGAMHDDLYSSQQNRDMCCGFTPQHHIMFGSTRLLLRCEKIAT